MLSVDDFRKKYPGSTPEQVALYAAAVAAEEARGPAPVEPDLPMPMVTVPAAAPPARISPSHITTYSRDISDAVSRVGRDWNPVDAPPARDLTTDIRRIVLGRRLSPAERAQAERPDMSGDDLLALLAGVPNAREFEALEGGD